MQSQYFLGCDWGTSSFRLTLFNDQTKKVEAAFSSDGGVLSTYEAWQNKPKMDGSSCEVFFRNELNKSINVLSAKISADLSNTTLVISGMASSSIGMRNLPYADVPFKLNGSNAITEKVKGDNILPNDIVMISGVKTTNDIMRGEEAQLIGMVDILKEINQYKNSAIFIFPGTHSKHVFIRGDQMIDFKTYMTGEIYSLLCEHSILKNSVDVSSMDIQHEDNVSAFRQGIQASKDDAFLNRVFSVRTNQILELLDKQSNAFYLSGLLIGSELISILNQSDCNIYLCCNNNLTAFYKLALDELGMLSRSSIISDEMMDQATLRGQMILSHF
jgi:2-dehydro-3-deoxygalactonokinase